MLKLTTGKNNICGVLSTLGAIIALSIPLQGRSLVAQARADVVQCVLGDIRARFRPTPTPKDERAKLLQVCQDGGVPVFLKKTYSGEEIPVVLVNSGTYPKLKEFMNSSVGTQIILQPDYKNDHGSFRLSDNLIDVDTPGARGFGETNETGLAWKPLSSYLSRRRSNAYKIIEVAYKVDPNEMQALQYYQRVRRGAIFRVPFTFGYAKADLNEPNMLKGAGEHCFLFCKGSTLDAQSAEIRMRLREFGVPDADSFLKLPEVKQFLFAAKSKILDADSGDISPKFLSKLSEFKLLKSVSPESATKNFQVFANWVTALDATLAYQQIFRRLKISGDIGWSDMNNGQAAAIFVYDGPDAGAAFQNATYQTQGKFRSWTVDQQRPAPKGLK